MLQSEITGMDAVASEISLVERSSRCAIHIFTQAKFLEVTAIKKQPEHIIKYIPAAEYPSGSYDPLENI